MGRRGSGEERGGREDREIYYGGHREMEKLPVLV